MLPSQQMLFVTVLAQTGWEGPVLLSVSVGQDTLKNGECIEADGKVQSIMPEKEHAALFLI